MKKSTKIILISAIVLLLGTTLFFTAVINPDRSTDNNTSQTQTTDETKQTEENDSTNPTIQTNDDKNTTDDGEKNNTNFQTSNTTKVPDNIVGTVDVLDTNTVVENKGKDDNNDNSASSGYEKVDAVVKVEEDTPINNENEQKENTSVVKDNDKETTFDISNSETNPTQQETITEQITIVEEEDISSELDDLFN